jgi:hypothetical protein
MEPKTIRPRMMYLTISHRIRLKVFQGRSSDPSAEFLLGLG